MASLDLTSSMRMNHPLMNVTTSSEEEAATSMATTTSHAAESVPSSRDARGALEHGLAGRWRPCADLCSSLMAAAHRETPEGAEAPATDAAAARGEYIQLCLLKAWALFRLQELGGVARCIEAARAHHLNSGLVPQDAHGDGLLDGLPFGVLYLEALLASRMRLAASSAGAGGADDMAAGAGVPGSKGFKVVEGGSDKLCTVRLRF